MSYDELLTIKDKKLFIKGLQYNTGFLEEQSVLNNKKGKNLNLNNKLRNTLKK